VWCVCVCVCVCVCERKGVCYQVMCAVKLLWHTAPVCISLHALPCWHLPTVLLPCPALYCCLALRCTAPVLPLYRRYTEVRV
jgi:hypothetical protein